ncbi:MAG: hypothetical protein CMF59_13085 [Leptospiraceae bacterium]|nr:hypothetical protein [Leptospiraceae bacterium]
MEENKQNSSDLADLPDLELDDLEFQEQADGLDSLDNETETNLDESFGDLDFSAESQPPATSADPFADIDDDAIATGQYDLPSDESDSDFSMDTDMSGESGADMSGDMDWGDSSFEEETFDSSDSDSQASDELTDFSAGGDDEIPLPPMMEDDDGPVSLSEDELDRILSTDDDASEGEVMEGTSLEEVDMAESEADFGSSELDSSPGAMSSDDFGSDEMSVGSDDFGSDEMSVGSDDFGSDEMSVGSDDFGSGEMSVGSDDFGSDEMSMSSDDLGSHDFDSEDFSMDLSDSEESASVADLESSFVDDESEGLSHEEFSDLENDFAADIPSMDEEGESDLEEELGGVPSVEEDEGPVALSEDELGNILEDVEDGDPQFAEGLRPEEDLSSIPLDSVEEDLEQEIPDLSDEGMGLEEDVMVKSGDDFSEASDDTDFPMFEDDLEEQGVSSAAESQAELEDLDISDDELSEAVLEGEDFSDEDFQAPPLSVLDGDEDESITLTPEELGNIVSDEEDYADDTVTQDAEALAFDEPSVSTDDTDAMDFSDSSADEMGGIEELEDFGDTPSILDEDEDETIALSASELDNILEDVTEEPIEEQGQVMEAAGLDSEAAAHEEERERNAIVIDEPEDFADTPEATEHQEALAESISQAEGLNKNELKKMISYLDRLFDQLPDDTVREFSRSEYFDLYKKLMQDLGIQ